MEATKRRFFSREYLNPRVLFMFPLGFALGLSYVLMSSTLCNYLESIGMATSRVSFLLAVVNIPLLAKLLWSSMIENTQARWIKSFGNFRFFLLLGLLGMSISLFCMSLLDPLTQFYLFALCLLIMAFSFSVVDNASGGIRIHLLPSNLLSYGTSVNTLGFRVGLLTSAAGALFLADYLANWQLVYLIGIVFLLIPMLVIFFSKKTLSTIQLSSKVSGMNLWERLKNNLLIMKEHHFSRQPWVKLYIFFFSTKVFDAIMNVLIWSFLRSLNFSMTQIALGILPAFLANILGSFVAGEVQSKSNYKKGLYAVALLQVLFSCVLLYMSLSVPTKTFLFVVLILGNIVGSFSLVALYTFYSLIVTKDNASLQFSYLTALNTGFKAIIISLSGLFFYFFEQQWSVFFIITAGFAILSFLTLSRLDSKVAQTTPEVPEAAS